MFVTVNPALLGLRFQERSHVRLRSQMTVPNITRSIALRAFLFVGAMSAIGSVTLAGAASSGSGPERAPATPAVATDPVTPYVRPAFVALVVLVAASAGAAFPFLRGNDSPQTGA